MRRSRVVIPVRFGPGLFSGLVAVASILLVAPARARSDEIRGPVTGAVVLPSGAMARYEYHHDRNALQDSRRQGEALIALTCAGTLLRFDVATRALTTERVEPARAVCLGGGDGDPVVVGFDDGRVCRVDPADLGLVELARAPGRAWWVGYPARGRGPGRLPFVVFARPGKDDDGRPVPDMEVVTRDLATGREVAAGGWGPAAFLDSKRRFWLGEDRGEWGGSCSCVDLAAADAKSSPVPGIGARGEGTGWDGVYGFVELRDGQVWAFGGTAHMGLRESFIRRVDRRRAEALFQADNTDSIKATRGEAVPPRPVRPEVPISQIIEEPDGNLLVFAFSDVYRVDPQLARWTKIHELRIGYRSGRPDAVGDYPALTAVHRLDDARLLCSTAVDGLVLIDGDRETHATLSGQLGAQRVARIEATVAGTLLAEWGDESPFWRFAAGAWRTVALAPPLEPHPDDPFARPGAGQSWSGMHLMVRPDRTIDLVCATGMTPGTRTTARFARDQPEVRGREHSSLYPSDSFVTPDGELWNTYYENLSRFIAGRWQVVAQMPRAALKTTPAAGGGVQVSDNGLQIGSGLRAVVGVGPPWLLLDASQGNLLALDPGREGRPPTLAPVPLADGGRAVRVRAALPWKDGDLLLATDKGLRRFDRRAGALGPSPVPEPGPDVDQLARDGLGRLWLAGGGLWVFDPGDKAAESLAPVPIIGPGGCATCVADPDHPDGVIAGLWDRGVVFLRVAHD